MIERFGGGRKEAPHRQVYEKEGLGRFEVDDLNAIDASDVKPGDRAIISTQSGNRYMLRHSDSREGQLVIYSERDGFDAAHAHPFMIRRRSSIAEIGKPMNIFAITDEQTNAGTEWTSTPVTRIEVRRGLDAAIKEAERQNQSGGIGTMMANMVKEQVSGNAKRDHNDTPDPYTHFK